MLAKERADSVLQPQERDDSFSHKRIWDTQVLFRVAFLVWKAYVGRIQTIDKLNNKGMNMVD